MLQFHVLILISNSIRENKRQKYPKEPTYWNSKLNHLPLRQSIPSSDVDMQRIFHGVDNFSDMSISKVLFKYCCEFYTKDYYTINFIFFLYLHLLF